MAAPLLMVMASAVAAWALGAAAAAGVHVADSEGRQVLSQHHHHNVDQRHVRSYERRQIRLYFHDTVNSTDFVIVGGVPGTTKFTTRTSPFGIVFCVHDPVSLSPSFNASPSARDHVVGTLMGTFTSVARDGLTYHSLFTLAFPAPKNTSDIDDRFPYHGTISVQGFLTGDPSLASAPASVVGGSGSFFLAQGFATLTPLDLSTYSQAFQIDLDLYLPKL